MEKRYLDRVNKGVKSVLGFLVMFWFHAQQVEENVGSL